MEVNVAPVVLVAVQLFSPTGAGNEAELDKLTEPPGQRALVLEDAVTEDGAVLITTEVVALAEHPAAEEATTVYVPAPAVAPEIVGF